MEMSFHSHAKKTHFHKKGCALDLILKVRVFGTRKWPINFTNFGIMNTHVRWPADSIILSHKQRKYRVYARRKVRGCAGGRRRAGGTLLLSTVLPQHQAHQKPALNKGKCNEENSTCKSIQFLSSKFVSAVTVLVYKITLGDRTMFSFGKAYRLSSFPNDNETFYVGKANK